MMTLSASACETPTRGVPTEPRESAFCARYPNKDHPPVWIEPGDSERETKGKIDLLILWEVECGIER